MKSLHYARAIFTADFKIWNILWQQPSGAFYIGRLIFIERHDKLYCVITLLRNAALSYTDEQFCHISY